MVAARFIYFNHSGISDMVNHWIVHTFTDATAAEVFQTYLRILKREKEMKVSSLQYKKCEQNDMLTSRTHSAFKIGVTMANTFHTNFSILWALMANIAP